jgi:hypothetical protein
VHSILLKRLEILKLFLPMLLFVTAQDKLVTYFAGPEFTVKKLYSNYMQMLINAA